MPEGWLNFALAILIVALKLLLVPRVALRLPAFTLYLLASLAMNLGYLFGHSATEEAWAAAAAVLGALAAMEAGYWVLAVGEHEGIETSRWCLMVALLVCTVVWLRQPEAYPNQWHLEYYVRLYAGAGSVGFLVAAIMYGFAQQCSTRLFAIHAALLLLYISAGAYALLTHDAANWYWADGTRQVASVLALCGWLWLLPHGRRGRARAAIVHTPTI